MVFFFAIKILFCVCMFSNDNRRYHWSQHVHCCFLKFLSWDSKVQDPLIYITQPTRVLSLFLFCEDDQENYTHICVHASLETYLSTRICGVMCNIKYIWKKQFWSPCVDSASALLTDNILKIMVVMTVYLITIVNCRFFLRKDNPVLDCPWFTDSVGTVF